MAGLFSRVKNWIKIETLKASDVNAEFDNIITNFIPQKMDDYSSTVGQMQTETSPGAQGSESQATSLAGELERLRYAIRRAVGGTYWYDNPSASLSSIASTLSSGLIIPRNRIDSGRVDANNQPMFLKAPSSGLTLTLDCTPTPLRTYIDNNLIEQSSDLTISLSSPSSYTLAINDALLTAQTSSKYQGEYDTNLTVDTSSGTPPTAGTYQAWKITHGGNTEYFLARYVSTTLLDKAKRGWFFDSADTWIPRIAISRNGVGPGDPITLCRIGYIFYVNTAGTGTLNVTYNRPTISYDTPTGSSVGDYWFDLNANVWKIYNGVDFSANTSIFIGVAVVDGANIVATRSIDFGKSYSDLLTFDLEKSDANTIKTKKLGAKVNVYGNGYDFSETHIAWSMSTDRDTGVSDSSSTQYYLYLTDGGDPVISDVIPHDRLDTLLGYYHPAKPWRCVGLAANDSSSNFKDPFSADFFKVSKKISAIYTTNAGNAITGTGADNFLDFEDKVIDNYNIVSGAGSGNVLTTNTGFKVIIPRASLFLLEARYHFGNISFTAGTNWSINVFVNGTLISSYNQETPTTNTAFYSAQINSLIYLYAGDRVEISASQNEGANRNMNTSSYNNRFSLQEVA